MNEELILILTFTSEQIQHWKDTCPSGWDWDDYAMLRIRELMVDEWSFDFVPDDINIGIKGYYQKKDEL